MQDRDTAEHYARLRTALLRRRRELELVIAEMGRNETPVHIKTEMADVTEQLRLLEGALAEPVEPGFSDDLGPVGRFQAVVYEQRQLRKTLQTMSDLMQKQLGGMDVRLETAERHIKDGDQEVLEQANTTIDRELNAVYKVIGQIRHDIRWIAAIGIGINALLILAIIGLFAYFIDTIVPILNRLA